MPSSYPMSFSGSSLQRLAGRSFFARRRVETGSRACHQIPRGRRGIRWQALCCKHFLYCLHRDEEPAGLSRESNEIVFEIKLARACFGAHHYGPGSYLPETLPSPFQSMEQQKLSQALAMLRLSNRHAPKQSNGQREPRQACASGPGLPAAQVRQQLSIAGSRISCCPSKP